MTAVIFDLDGTLIDSLPDITDAANALLAEWEAPPIGPDLTVGFVGHGVGTFIDRLIAVTDLPGADRSRLLDRFMAHYEAAARNTRMMPGALEALGDLRDEGWQLGLCTNKARAPLVPTLEAAGLTEMFDAVVAGDDLEKRKPDPAPLLHCMKMMDAERCVYVGDSDVDGETAKRARMPFVLYTKGIRTVAVEDIPHDIAFDDFTDLPGLLARLA